LLFIKDRGGNMANIIDYLKWRGDLTFRQAPFNEVDVVILARLSYIFFDDIVPENLEKSVRIRDAAKQYLSDDSKVNSAIYEDDVELISLMGESRRFGKLKLMGYVNQLDEEMVKQFSAVTIRLDNRKYFVSYRGTDKTFVGWREDCDMAYAMPVPSQISAVQYLNSIAANLEGNLILGGHSKGGNIAIYAASECEHSIKERIEKVYSLDGPGFSSKIGDNKGYAEMLPKIYTYIPQSSIVGMLMEHGEDYVIVRSSKEGLLQHDVYTWEVTGPKLIHEDDITDESKILNASLSEWLNGMDYEQRKQFVDSLFALLEEGDSKTTDELSAHWYKGVGKLLSSFKKLDEENKKTFIQNMQALMKITKKNHMNSNKEKFRREN
jgi:hypothetical protein